MAGHDDMPADQLARREAALAGLALVADRRTAAALVAWAGTDRHLVRMDRKPRRNPLRPPGDGTAAAVGAWYRDHHLGHRPGLLRMPPALRAMGLV